MKNLKKFRDENLKKDSKRKEKNDKRKKGSKLIPDTRKHKNTSQYLNEEE